MSSPRNNGIITTASRPRLNVPRKWPGLKCPGLYRVSRPPLSCVQTSSSVQASSSTASRKDSLTNGLTHLIVAYRCGTSNGVSRPLSCVQTSSSVQASSSTASRKDSLTNGLTHLIVAYRCGTSNGVLCQDLYRVSRPLVKGLGLLGE